MHQLIGSYRLSMVIPLSRRFCTTQVVQDFFRQQYHLSLKSLQKGAFSRRPFCEFAATGDVCLRKKLVSIDTTGCGFQELERKTYLQDPCMLCFPTFSSFLRQMLVNIPYMDPMVKENIDNCSSINFFWGET